MEISKKGLRKYLDKCSAQKRTSIIKALAKENNVTVEEFKKWLNSADADEKSKQTTKNDI